MAELSAFDADLLTQDLSRLAQVDVASSVFSGHRGRMVAAVGRVEQRDRDSLQERRADCAVDAQL